MSTTGGNKGTNYSKLIPVSSTSRIPGSNYSTSNFIVNAGQNLQNIYRVSISTVSFFNNMYNIVNDGTGNNTTLTYTYLANPPHTFTLPPGFYSISQIIGLLNADLNTNTAGSASFSFNSTTNLVSFTVLAGEEVTLNTGPNPNNQLMVTLGGGPLALIPSIVVAGGSNTTITATTFPLLSGPTQVYIRSAALAPANSVDSQGRFTNTLLALNVTAPFLQLNQFECKVDILCELTYPSPRDLSNIDIQLTDRDGNIIDLHGGTLNIELKVWLNRY